MVVYLVTPDDTVSSSGCASAPVAGATDVRAAFRFDLPA